MSLSISSICIYTIRQTEKLQADYAKNRKTKITENKNWATANRLFKECKSNNIQMLVLFAPAEDTRELIFFGLLEAIEINKKEGQPVTTTYQVSNLTPFEGKKPKKTSLIVRSTGKPIPQGFIRPYAICKTPKALLSTDLH